VTFILLRVHISLHTSVELGGRIETDFGWKSNGSDNFRIIRARIFGIPLDVQCMLCTPLLPFGKESWEILSFLFNFQERAMYDSKRHALTLPVGVMNLINGCHY